MISHLSRKITLSTQILARAASHICSACFTTTKHLLFQACLAQDHQSAYNDIGGGHAPRDLESHPTWRE